jgi:site-specific recombinase XerD
LGPYIQRFFADYLTQQRDCSANTVTAYRDSISLFLRHIREHAKIQPESATVDDLNVVRVLGFLNHRQNERKNSASTRNARLAGIRALARYILMSEPTFSRELQPVLAIPCKRTPRRVLDFLNDDEVEAILDSPNPEAWSGRRDRVLFLTLFNSGARASEILAVKGADLRIGATSTVRLHGKGRKERVLPLWRKTARALSAWIKANRIGGDELVFANARGSPLSRSGLAKRLTKAATLASTRCHSIKRLQVSPHTFRHTTAMHLLRAGVDITVIAMWLGHSSIETTHVYVTADMTMKERGLAALRPPNQAQRRFRPSDSLLSFLESL